MQVSIPNRSRFAKTVGGTLISLTMSVGVNAFNGQQTQQQPVNQQPSQSCPCDGSQSQSQWSSQNGGGSFDTVIPPWSGGITACPSSVSCNAPTGGATGATITRVDCPNTATDCATFSKKVGAKALIENWYAEGVVIEGKFGSPHSWTGSTWTGVLLDNARLYHIDAIGATFNNVKIAGHLKHVDFSKGDITATTYSGIYQDVDFRNASLKNVRFENAEFKATRWGKRSNFDHATLENVDFINVTMGSMTFTDAKLKNVTFPCSIIKNTSYFKDADVWDVKHEKWVKLTGEHLDQLGGYITKNKIKQVNLSAWMSGQ